MNGITQRRRREGFTLIEIMVAVGLLLLGVASTLGLMKWIVQGTDYSGRVTRATFAAQTKMEDLLALGYTALSSGSDSTNGLTRSWTVASAGGGTYKTVTLTVSWTGVTGNQQSMTVKTIVAEP